MRQLAKALHHAHDQGLVHRDIKPGNILLSREDIGFDSRLEVALPSRAGERGLELDQAFVADFGLALKTEDVQTASQVAGTPAYMSPEQITGDVSQLDGRSDIFSLGVVFYELLVGERPFQGKSLADLLTNICASTPKAPDHWHRGVPETLSAICMKCLAKQPANRYRTGSQLADALDQWLALEERVQATPEAPSPQSAGNSFGVVMALVGLVLLVAFTRFLPSSQAPDKSGSKPLQIAAPPSNPTVPNTVVQYIPVPVEAEEDQPPMGFSRGMWEHLPEQMKRTLRPQDPLHRGAVDPLNPLGRRSRSGPMSNLGLTPVSSLPGRANFGRNANRFGVPAPGNFGPNPYPYGGPVRTTAGGGWPW